MRKELTIIEVLSVLVLMTVIVAGVVNLLPNSQVALATEANRTRSHLRHAQLKAQADVYHWRLAFKDAQTYEIGPVVIPGAGFTPTLIPGSNATERTLPDGVVADPNFGVRFDSWGRPLNDAGMLSSSDISLSLSDGDGSEEISILAGSGLIR